MASTFAKKIVQDQAGASNGIDEDGRQVIEVWPANGTGFVVTIDAAKNLADAIEYAIRRV